MDKRDSTANPDSRPTGREAEPAKFDVARDQQAQREAFANLAAAQDYCRAVAAGLQLTDKYNQQVRRDLEILESGYSKGQTLGRSRQRNGRASRSKDSDRER